MASDLEVEPVAMTPDTASSGDSPLVSLRLRKADGAAYVRPPGIIAALLALSAMPAKDLIQRVRIADSQHQEYIPSECVLYFVRHPPGNNPDTHRQLFELIRQRVLAAVPVVPRKLSGPGKPGENVVDLDIREAVLHKFQILLCKNRKDYEVRLDYYECRFNDAIASLRATARRDVRREAERFEPLEKEANPAEPSPEVAKALSKLRDPASAGGDDFLYRAKVLRAISRLPDKERRVIELILQGYQIDSNNDEEQTIAKILDCAEKTVRNRRDSAYQKLRDTLSDGEENA